MRSASTTVTPCGRVLLSVRLPCGCCSTGVLLDIVAAHQLAAELYAAVAISAHVLIARAGGQWVHPEADT